MSFFGCPEMPVGVKVVEKRTLEIKFFLPLQIKQRQIDQTAFFCRYDIRNRIPDPPQFNT